MINVDDCDFYYGLEFEIIRCTLGKNKNYLGFLSLNRTFGLKPVGRRHLGNEKKNEFFFCISLGLHYLCNEYV